MTPLGIKTAFSPLGIVIALVFIGLPFVVRTLQPAIEEIDRETEEAAASLGASRLQAFRRVILPAVLPALLTGFTLAFARALGEYGSVVFISGNMPFKTEIASLLIISKLEQYDYTGATAIATVMLAASFALLLGDQPAAMVGGPELSRCSMSQLPIQPWVDTLRRRRWSKPIWSAACGWRPKKPRWVRYGLIGDLAHVPDAGAVRAAGGDLCRSASQGHRRVLRQLHRSRTRCRRFG